MHYNYAHLSISNKRARSFTLIFSNCVPLSGQTPKKKVTLFLKNLFPSKKTEMPA